MEFILFIIQVSQLDTLGFHKVYRHLAIAFMLVVITYFICKPLIVKLIKGHYILFLTYIIISLLLMTMSLTIALIDKKIHSIILALQAISLFGICLIVFVTYKLIKKMIITKLQRTPHK